VNPDRLLLELGRKVRALRALRGWTLRQLASAASLSARFVVQLEAGRANISVRKLAGLAGALGTTPAELLSGPGGEPGLPVVALLGLRGAGKSTIGRRLARRLRVRFVELDGQIEEAAGLSLDEIFALHGETYYRRLEREALERVLSEEGGRPFILATGGGLPTSDETWRLLRQAALTVWLKARPEDHWNRVVQQGDRRPMADHPQAMAELRRLLLSREPLYAGAAHTLDTSRLTVEAAVRHLAALVRAQGAAPARSRGRRDAPLLRRS
jgi:XRE family transcriptional regulator, aerobic/anaerobic benzoate catabolism transcriptional regulator